LEDLAHAATTMDAKLAELAAQVGVVKQSVAPTYSASAVASKQNELKASSNFAMQRWM